MDVIREAFGLILQGDEELLQIIRTTLIMSLFSTGVSALIGLPFGVFLGRSSFRGKGALLRITNTLMSLPPVVAGLVVFLLFRSIGPFGGMHLMFTVQIMVIAQVILITPIMTGMAASSAGGKAPLLTETARGLHLGRFTQDRLLLKECAVEFISVILLGFGRSIAEVGAVSLVGGNIQFKTRVMTTAILLETNKGNFDTAVALGLVLLLLSLVANSIAVTIQERVS
ncbi:MAG: ABC transporter permease [Clostridia bacterium]|nr:ABC transporter permease [Clostridia bacterium]